MFQELSVTSHPLSLAIVSVTAIVLLWLVFVRPFHTPIPGIPYNLEAAKKFMGDLPEIQERQKDGASIRPWFLEQAYRHKSAIMQIFLGPFSQPTVLISDFREANDILMYREADFKRGKKVEVFQGILPHAFPAMETFDPRFKGTRDLVKDVMTLSFLHKVSAPKAHEAAVNLMELWRLKNQMAKGRPFNVADDIVEFSFDAILSAATGLGASGGDVKQQLLHLQKARQEYEESALTKGSANLKEPVQLPALKRSRKLSALSTDEESLWKGFYMPSPRLYHFFNRLRPVVRDARQVLRDYINSQIADSVPRLRADGAPECALDYVIQREIKAADKAGRAPILDDPRIRDQVYGYLIAGHDTSAGTLCWLVRRLVANPEEQVKIRNSLRQTYSQAWEERRLPTDQELTKHAPYLDAFLEEVLRYNCPVVTIMVVTRHDTVILGHPVPKETPVFLNLTGPSMSKPSVPVEENRRSETSRTHNKLRANWDDMEPDKFMPERWLEEKEDGTVTFNALAGPTLSFSAGNRGCWGKRLGYLELRVVLSVLVWSFNFESIPKEVVDWDTYDSLVTAPKNCFVQLTDAY